MTCDRNTALCTKVRRAVKIKQHKIQHNKTTLVQWTSTTLGQETRWAYSTAPEPRRGEGVWGEGCGISVPQVTEAPVDLNVVARGGQAQSVTDVTIASSAASQIMGDVTMACSDPTPHADRTAAARTFHIFYDKCHYCSNSFNGSPKQLLAKQLMNRLV